MISALDDLLTRALLIDHTTTTPEAESLPTGCPSPEPASGRAFSDPDQDRERLATAAARDLRSLCEAVVTGPALTTLLSALSNRLPTPSGGLVLACVLRLNRADEAARFWWQYAAGAGDDDATTAAYCLYLHHLALGEHHDAAWWQRQTPEAAPPIPHPSQTLKLHPGKEPADQDTQPESHTLMHLEWPGATETLSVATTLRLLSILKLSNHGGVRIFPSAVAAVMDYIAITVRFSIDPDIELPLLEEGFHNRIRDLTTPRPKPTRPEVPPLPRRRPAHRSPVPRTRSRTPWSVVAYGPDVDVW
ncbi:hypothetical protein [Streptomyces sp. NRRL B-1347]|uniref:hypothetical protein n=1 Tax=Streptomyces sp. NRRL B-1347 TaxID=1476877 RepID=UPI00068B1146|nr:hypothetical protein [Streptomyces sp. NRRL B-1347]